MEVIKEETESIAEEEEKEEVNSDLQVSEDKNEKSPETELGSIWIPCSICHKSINECLLSYHKQQHKALTLLGYKLCEEPTGIQSLNFQKQQAISQIKSSSVYKEREVQKINHAYEILKGMLCSSAVYTNTMDTNINVNAQVYQIDNNDLVRAIAICSDKNISWQKEMEDSFTVQVNYGKRTNTCFVGVFDGCNGSSAACTVSTELPILFLSQLSTTDPSYTMTEEEINLNSSFDTIFKPEYNKMVDVLTSTVHEQFLKVTGFEWIHTSYAKAFWRMDRILRLGRKENSKARWSGCTAVTCLIDGILKENTSEEKDDFLEPNTKATKSSKYRLGVLHIANIGNIRAVLCKTGKSYCLTKTHSTLSSSETKRVRERGGSLSSNEDCGLVEGISQVTRGLGFHGDPKLKNSVIPVPHTVSIPIYDSSQFLILASSGLWEVLNEFEVVAIAKESLTSFLQGSHKSKAENDHLQNSMPENDSANPEPSRIQDKNGTPPFLKVDSENTNEVDLSKQNHNDLRNLSMPVALNDKEEPPVLKQDSKHNTYYSNPSKIDHYDPSNQEEPSIFKDNNGTHSAVNNNSEKNINDADPLNINHSDPSNQETHNTLHDKDSTPPVLKQDSKSSTSVVDLIKYDHYNAPNLETLRISDEEYGTPTVPKHGPENTNVMEITKYNNYPPSNHPDPNTLDDRNGALLVMEQASKSNTNEADMSTYYYNDRSNVEAPNILGKHLTTSIKKPDTYNTNEADLSKDPSDEDKPKMLDGKSGTTSVRQEYSATGTVPECSDPSKDKSRETYNQAAIFTCEQLVKAALSAGSRQNITVCLILLPGCVHM